MRWRDKGKYRSITLTLHFENAEQVGTPPSPPLTPRRSPCHSARRPRRCVHTCPSTNFTRACARSSLRRKVYAVYAAIDRDPRVKFKI